MSHTRGQNKVPKKEYWDVDEILDHRVTGTGKKEYLVSWLGSGPEDNSWEPEAQLMLHIPIVVKEFNQMQMSRSRQMDKENQPSGPSTAHARSSRGKTKDQPVKHTSQDKAVKVLEVHVGDNPLDDSGPIASRTRSKTNGLLQPQSSTLPSKSPGRARSRSKSREPGTRSTSSRRTASKK